MSERVRRAGAPMPPHMGFRLVQGDIRSDDVSSRAMERPWRLRVPAVSPAEGAVAPCLTAVAPALPDASGLSAWRCLAGRLRCCAAQSHALRRSEVSAGLQSPLRCRGDDGARGLPSPPAPNLASPLTSHPNPCRTLTLWAAEPSASSPHTRSRPVRRRTISRQLHRLRLPVRAFHETPFRGSRIALEGATERLPAQSASEGIAYKPASTTRASCPQTPGDRR